MSFNLGCRRSCLCSKNFPDSSSKTAGLPELVGLVCTITLGGLWDTYDGQIEMAALSRLRIFYDELLPV